MVAFVNEARYAAAGVDIDAGNRMVEMIKPLVRATARAGTDGEIGGFGGLFDLKAAGFSDPILVAATDGVGTKVKIAIETSRHDTIGIDLVAMSVNDLVVQGAEPLFFLDYFACGKLDPAVGAAVVKGVAAACREAGCALIGGETAEMPGVYQGGDYDLAGFAVGAVGRKDILPRADIKAGDVVLGLASTGVHSNGFSLVRRVAETAGLTWESPAPFDPARNLGEALLTPTRLYVRSCLAAIRETKAVKALAHITGGGFTENIPRVLPAGLAVALDLGAVPVLPVFKWLAGVGRHQHAPKCCARSIAASAWWWWLDRDLADAAIERIDGPWRESRPPRRSRRRRGRRARRLSWTTRPDVVTRMTRKRVAILISGRGSNMAALIDAAKAPDYPAEIVLVVSNRPDALGLVHAREAGIATALVDHRTFGADREGFERAIDADTRRTIGSISSALPASCGCSRPGSSPAGAAACSISIRRCFRRSKACIPTAARSRPAPHVTAPPCISSPRKWIPARSFCRRRCRCCHGDTEETLSRRVLEAEHRIYPEALRRVAEGRVAFTPDA